MTVTFERMLVTPELAEQWLEHNDSNRNLKPANVSRFTRDMQRGAWSFIGDPIRLSEPDENGVEYLLDGQNRLTSVVASGIPQPFMVFRGLTRETQVVMDSGTSRSVADTLRMAQHNRSSQLAAAARIIWAIGLGAERFSSTRDAATNTEIIALLKSNPLIEASLKDIEGVHAKSKLRYPVGTVMHYFGMVREPDMTQEFFHRIRSGADMREGDPVLSFRNRTASEGHKLTTNSMLFLGLRAMNLTRNGQRSTKMQLPRGVRVSGTHIIGEIRNLTSERPTEVQPIEDGV